MIKKNLPIPKEQFATREDIKNYYKLADEPYETLQGLGFDKANRVRSDALTWRVKGVNWVFSRQISGNSFELFAFNVHIKKFFIIFRYVEAGKVNYIEYLKQFFVFK